MAGVGLVGERHPQDGDIIYNRCGDGGDEEQDRCYEEQEGADMMEDACLRHCECLLLI